MTNAQSKRKVCFNCGGSGYTRVKPSFSDITGELINVCPTCKGSGSVEQISQQPALDVGQMGHNAPAFEAEVKIPLAVPSLLDVYKSRADIIFTSSKNEMFSHEAGLCAVYEHISKTMEGEHKETLVAMSKQALQIAELKIRAAARDAEISALRDALQLVQDFLSHSEMFRSVLDIEAADELGIKINAALNPEKK